MEQYKKEILEEIERKQDLVSNLADRVWEYAELSLKEEKSAALFAELLEKEGFDVVVGNNQIPTAFIASYGSGRPVIGLLAEYDALSGLSQQRGLDRHCEISEGGSGHGCGHNLLGAGAFAAALGLKKYLETHPGKGTVRLFGCPGEEAAASKAFMARDGVWKELDAALTWHPEDRNEVAVGSTNSCLQNLYRFYGRASHASGSPELGRSALDAVELMNIGVQFLREHMDDKARIHYAITNAGGVSPNVVQARADVLYYVRANHVSEALELQKRVDKIAEGAALMTETEYTKTFIDGLADTISNPVLEEVLYRCFEEIGVPRYTEEELEFTDRIAETVPGSGLGKTGSEKTHIPGLGSTVDSAYRDKAAELIKAAGHGMNDFLLPLFKGDVFRAGSTDVGDVSWLCPTAQIHVAAWPNGTPGHSWQNVSCAGSTVGKKAALTAGRVLAAAAAELFENPELLSQARSVFEKRTGELGGYQCPVPDGAVIRAL
ncbi:MAG: amidohydrolase [Lachnospiraceae bacterium]|nr:amidohydrolase [Lachnospiraceae bacterium]